MIPSSFHRVWFGSAPIPATYEAWWQGWQRQYPQAQFKTWRDDDAKCLPLLQSQIQAAEGAARKADLARYEILLRHGGIYIDSDMMPYHRFEFDRVAADLVVCNESDDNRYCSNSFIAARAGLSMFERMVEAARIMRLNDLPANEETGPWFFGRHVETNLAQRLPTQAFYPYGHAERFSSTFSRCLDNSYGIHVWSGSWLDRERRLERAMASLVAGDLHDSQALLGDLKDKEAATLCDLSQRIRFAREAAFDAATHPALLNSATADEARPFALLKGLNYLLEREADALLWQIGAADGILVDPIRPMMVLHDPRAVLFEPHPRIFSMLEKNYARNDRAILVNGAVGPRRGEMGLNAIDTDAARELGLPDWVLGISSAFDDRNPIGGLDVAPELAAQIGRCVSRLEVPALDVASALTITAGEAPDIVVVDAEGMDAAVVCAILDFPIRPRLIQYEAQWMTGAEQDSLAARLDSNYVCFRFGNDCVAYRNDFLLEYAQHLYIQHGLPTLFAANLRFALRV